MKPKTPEQKELITLRMKIKRMESELDWKDSLISSILLWVLVFITLLVVTSTNNVESAIIKSALAAFILFITNFIGLKLIGWLINKFKN